MYLVIGAGVVGAAVAYELARGGEAVTLLEAERPAGGTSGSSFAWTNANEKPPRPYHDLNAAGLAEYHRLARELAGGWFHPTGNLSVASAPADQTALEARVTRLREWGYAAELIDAARVAALAPDLTIPSGALGAFFPEEGWVAVTVLVHALLEAATQHGARVVYPAPVEELAVQSGRVVGARVGETVYPADVVIDCAGPRAGHLLESLGRKIRRQRSPGLLAISEALATCLAPVVHFASEGVYFRPDGGGRVRIGSEEVDGALPADDAAVREAASPGSPQARDLLDRARAVFPPLVGARLEAVRLGWRAMPGDGFSAVGPVPGVAGYYLAFTHSGVTLGPLLGRLVADEVQGHPADLLARFRPDRLVVG